MADVVCTNPACEELDVPKNNDAGYPVESIICGRCGEPVSELPEEGVNPMSDTEPTPEQPEPEPETPEPEQPETPPAEPET
jgi:hypothetical protein